MTQLRPLLIAALILTIDITTVLVHAWLVPDPYMDEPFHVKQTQSFCSGSWGKWDSKITTFPGSYLLPAVVGRLFYWSGGKEFEQAVCSTTALRLYSVFWTMLTFLVADILVLRLSIWDLVRNGASKSLNSLKSLPLVPLALVLWPPQHFYSGLVYTDAASTLSVIICWRLAFGQNSARSDWKDSVACAIAGIFAIGMRQTNAVWVAMAAGMVLCRQQWEEDRQSDTKKAIEKAAKSKDGAFTGTRGGWQGGLLGVVRGRIGRPQAFQDTVRRVGGMAIVLLAFVVFVIWNGGVVVGDKSNHAPVLHWAQPLYLVLVCGGALMAADAAAVLLGGGSKGLSTAAVLSDIPLLVSLMSCGLRVPAGADDGAAEGAGRGEHEGSSSDSESDTGSEDEVEVSEDERKLGSGSGLRRREEGSSGEDGRPSVVPPIRRKKAGSKESKVEPAARGRGSPCLWGTFAALLLLWLAVVAAAVHYGTYSHPFILADNRHVTFYWWRFMRRNTVRYWLVPAYVLCGLVVLGRVARQWRSIAVAQVLGLACCLALVPAHLVEPRYFNVPVIAVFLLTGLSPTEAGALSAGGMAVHLGMLAVFWFRSYRWVDRSIARLMW